MIAVQLFSTKWPRVWRVDGAEITAGDFASWKKYLGGEEVPEPAPKTMTAQALEYVTPWR